MTKKRSSLSRMNLVSSGLLRLSLLFSFLTLTVTAVSASQLNLSWEDNASNEVGFKIQRKTGANGTYVQINTVGANTTTYSDTGLLGNTTYCYRVRAFNSAGDSGLSNEACATTTVQQNGACLSSGTVIRVTTVPGNSPSTIYVRPSALSPVFFSSTTSDAKLLNAARQALRRQTRVTVAGTAAVCPAATAGGSLGTTNFLIVNP